MPIAVDIVEVDGEERVRQVRWLRTIRRAKGHGDGRPQTQGNVEAQVAEANEDVPGIYHAVSVLVPKVAVPAEGAASRV